MKKIISCLTISLIICCSLLISSCISRAPYPVQNQYGLTITPPKKTRSFLTNDILKIDEVNIASQFSDVYFIYRTSKVDYINDYYNVFISSPADQINQLIAKYLSDGNLFKFVAYNTNNTKPNFILHANVHELYADYRNANHPKAVMTIQFTLFKPNHKTHLIFNKTYSESISLQDKDSTSLVSAWNIGLQRILTKLTWNLRGLLED